MKKIKIKDDKVLGNFLAGQKLVFGVCDYKPVACLEKVLVYGAELFFNGRTFFQNYFSFLFGWFIFFPAK